MAEITHVGILGFGQMGSGIAQVCAEAGFQTMVRDVEAAALERGLGAIARRLDRRVEKEELSKPARDAALNRIRATTSLEELAECDLVIEAVVEDAEVKNALWRELDGICGSETIFASNTSSLTITEMAAVTSRPGQLIGLHFFNPVPVMRLVEVVRTIATEDRVFSAAMAFVRALGKEPVEARDSSGFIVNRLLVPYMMDAIRLLEGGAGTVSDIDLAMRLGTGHPMGPLTLCDFVGLDTLERIGGIMFDEYREQRFAAPPLLRRMVALGNHGRKSGRGFYDYSQDPPVPVRR